ncbi:hypothetical protein BHE74_00023813 [Ensete ventricosum]|nr:hypothetical protein GW17_00019141 [Ensete ventricosum]RWW68647.1 hypothetical protein BHE74_00023813 [Ensete ventricosum]RZS06045.1 hypothetical protein BHM03_00036635 [Ensete ventricosum]
MIFVRRTLIPLSRTLEASMVDITTNHLEEDAIQWYNWLEHTQGVPTWRQFKSGMLICFRPSKYKNIDGQLALGQSEDDAVGNSLGVRQELAEGVGSLPGWRKGVRRKKTETRWKIIRGNRKACWELDFPEGIGKIARNTLEDRQRKTVRLATGNA